MMVVSSNIGSSYIELTAVSAKSVQRQPDEFKGVIQNLYGKSYYSHLKKVLKYVNRKYLACKADQVDECCY
jgi:hypothetical protein